MKNKIRQGQTRWSTAHYPPGRLEGCSGDAVAVWACQVTKVTWHSVHYRMGDGHHSTSHWGWRRKHATFRRAMASAVAQIDAIVRHNNIYEWPADQ